MRIYEKQYLRNKNKTKNKKQNLYKTIQNKTKQKQNLYKTIQNKTKFIQNNTKQNKIYTKQNKNINKTFNKKRGAHIESSDIVQKDDADTNNSLLLY